ncbi:sulfurtransferase TusA family protein [Paenibacillus algorifonticola]
MKANYQLDCKGLACPLPIVRTKKAMNGLAEGQVIEVQATDKGSLADFQSWARTVGHHYLGTVQQGDILKHYLRKLSSGETGDSADFAITISNEELEQLLTDGSSGLVLLDVREPAEYAFGHINGAVSLPLGELEQRVGELDQAQTIYVICRSGVRSSLACKLLNSKGMEKVVNVLPGMSGWQGTTI